MRRWAFAAILVLAAAGPVRGQTTLETPGPDEAPSHDPSKLILPGQPDRPGAPVETLPPLWLVPLPDAATREAERAALDARLAARFSHDRAPPPQRFERDIIPLAGGLPWQAMERRLNGTLGP